jgi:hypothetical protein
MLLGLFSSLLGGGKLDRDRVYAMAQEGEEFNGLDLTGLDLRGIAFVQREFNGARMPGVRLGAAEITQCEFNQADLSGADMRGATFTQCEFNSANLQGALLDGATFTQCEFGGANMTGAFTTGVNFSQCEGLGVAAAAAGLPASTGAAKFWDIDEDDQKWAVAVEHAGKLAQAAQGKVKERKEDDEIHVTGQYEGRPFRVKIDASDGEFELQLKFQNRLGVVVVTHDADKKGGAGGGGDRDEWDDADGREETFFLAPGVFLEEMPAELEPMKALLAQNPAVAQHIAAYMPAQQARYLRIDSEVIELSFDGDVLQRDIVQGIGTALATASWLAAAFEGGSSDVAAKPRVYIGGQPAAVGTGGTIVTCKFCHNTVPLTPQRKCPNCGGLN